MCSRRPDPVRSRSLRGRPVQAERPADVLHDLGPGAAGVGEADGLHSTLTGDVDAFPENPHGGEEGPAYVPAPASMLLALSEHFAPFGR